VDQERNLSEIEEDIRSTAEDVFADAAELKSIEKVKATLPADDPRLLGLAKKADELGEKIAAKTAAELQLAKDAAGA
jgi:hypothetical protein